MLTTVSTKGQTVIPLAIREMAQVAAGDELEVGYFGGMIIMRKREPLTPTKIRSLLLAARRLPEMEDADALAVERVVNRVRRRGPR